MIRKILTKSMVLVFISVITACSTGGDGAFSARPQSAPAIQNPPNSSNNTPENISSEESPQSDQPDNNANTNNTSEMNNEATNTNREETNTENPGSGSNPGSNPGSGTGTENTTTPEIANTSPPSNTDEMMPSEPAEVKPDVKFSDNSGSLLGGARSNIPVPLPGNERKFINSLGTDRLRINDTDTARDNKPLSDFHYNDNVFLDNSNIDPTKVQTLEVKDDSGNVVGTFRFIKQSQSVYLTFMPVIPRAQADNSVELFTGLYSYIGTPTTDSDFNSLKGQATYTGKVLGYSYDLKVGDDARTTSYNNLDALPTRPTLATPADITLTVDFDDKTLSGKITNRFDHLAALNSKFTDDNEKVTPQGLDLDKQPLYLSANIIKNDNGTWGFQGPFGGSEGVYTDEAKTRNVAGIGGIFIGEGAKEIVGLINSKEMMAFGATKNTP